VSPEKYAYKSIAWMRRNEFVEEQKVSYLKVREYRGTAKAFENNESTGIRGRSR
jgi:DMSO/TMAO reductase YedYZ molybdopterin-dependent catalytic subunit